MSGWPRGASAGASVRLDMLPELRRSPLRNGRHGSSRMTSAEPARAGRSGSRWCCRVLPRPGLPYASAVLVAVAMWNIVRSRIGRAFLTTATATWRPSAPIWRATRPERSCSVPSTRGRRRPPQCLPELRRAGGVQPLPDGGESQRSDSGRGANQPPAR